MIDRKKYVRIGHGIEVVTAGMIIREHGFAEGFSSFKKWILGQTVAELPNGEPGYYATDYERWAAQYENPD